MIMLMLMLLLARALDRYVQTEPGKVVENWRDE